MYLMMEDKNSVGNHRWLSIYFLARVCDVSLATIRTLMVVRDKKLYAAIIGF